ncbi:universal stress protein [Salinigranum salinum]|uniref:universal stress protein n=1 Tax=Salinigranum salinum TaxID=1364937 RepID=UPI00126106F5|nr:universal stress protein [Salinigranum salinum]
MTRILVALDGSDPSEKALSFVLDHHADAELTVLTVLDPAAFVQGSADVIPPTIDSWRDEAEAEARATLDAAVDRAEAVGVDLDTDLVYGSPARAIVRYADDHDVDQIVVGCHGRDGVSRILLGSVAETVVRRSSVPVTVVR